MLIPYSKTLIFRRYSFRLFFKILGKCSCLNVLVFSRNTYGPWHRYFSPETPTADYVILSPFTSFYTDVDKYSRVIQLTQDSDLEARGILWESTDVSRNVARIQSRLHFPTNIQTVALSYLMPGLPVLLYGDELALESKKRK